MSLLTSRGAIGALLSTYSGSPPIIAENITPSSPADIAGEFARWCVRPATTRDSDVGAKNERTIGTLYFQHFNPETKGTLPAYTFANKIGTLLNRKRVASGGGVLTFERAEVKYVGKDAGLLQHNVMIEFREDAPAVNATI